MSDSDMDIDDDEVQVNSIAGESKLLHTPIKPSDFQLNDVKKHSDEQLKIIKDSFGNFTNSQANISGNNGKSIKLEDGICTTLSDSVLRFPAPGITTNSFLSRNEPEQKRAAMLCKFFAKGFCNKGNSCRFLHVKENSNHAENIMARSSSIVQSVDSKEGVRASLLNKNGVTSLVNPQRVFPSINMNEMRFINNSNSFALRSSFVQEHRNTNMESSGPVWTGSLFNSVPINEYASNAARHFENRNNIYGSGSLPTLQEISVSSDQDAAEGNTSSNEKKVSSNDWEPSEAFQPSFTIPPYILPSSDALYDPFMDIENPEDRSLKASLSSKGKQKDGDSSSCPQARDSNNDDKNSSCSQNQHQEKAVARKNLEAHGIVEGVATSVVDQNDATTPSKEISSSSAAVEKIVVLKRCKPAEQQKMLKSDEVDGEVRSEAGMKGMRQFRNAVVETIKEMLKPLWREGCLTKDVHNMIVKRATEKIVNTAVQYHKVPTETESVDQYLSMFAPKIVKLVEGYVEKYGKPSSIK